VTHQPAAGKDGAGSGRLLATMDGAVTEVLVQEGDAVQQGQPLVVLEAMKMEHPVKADCDGVVAGIHAVAGDQVSRNQLLVEIATTGDAEPTKQ
jgi:geranyl-CoA carboxylase alpha subunit